MLGILMWLVYGLVVGSIAKLIYPGSDPSGCLPTIGIGIAGSYVGGLLNYILFGSGYFLSPSGVIMGIIGAIIFLFAYHKLMASYGAK